MKEFGDERADRYGELWAEVYDTEHALRAPTDAQLDLLADPAGDGRALELGIGTGRVAVPLSARGVRVKGVDASPAMVERMRTKPGGAPIPVAIGDMRDPPVDGPFSVVYVVFNTLFALVSQRAQSDCFRSVSRLLGPKGVFCIECFVPDLTRFDRGQSTRTLTLDDTTTRINAALHDPVNQTVASNLITFRHESPPTVRPVRLRYAWPSELDLMAELAGLELHQRFANWEGDPFVASSDSHVSLYNSP